MRISVFGSQELQATILALKTLDKETRKQIRTFTKAMVDTEWAKALNAEADTDLERAALVATGRVRVSDQNVTLTSATVGRRLAGGLLPKRDAGGVEFGAAKVAKTYQSTSPKGRRFSVTRETRNQLNARKKTGYVVYPAAAQIIPRIAALWIQTTARTIFDMLERRA